MEGVLRFWDIVLCRSRLIDNRFPWIIRSSQRRHRWRTDAIPAHVDLLSLRERLAVGVVADAPAIDRFTKSAHQIAALSDRAR